MSDDLSIEEVKKKPNISIFIIIIIFSSSSCLDSSKNDNITTRITFIKKSI